MNWMRWMPPLCFAAVLVGCCFPNAQVFQQDFINTGNRLDLAIQGNGYFALQKPSGKRCFTRVGRFVRSTTGQVTTPDGWPGRCPSARFAFPSRPPI